MFNWIARQSGHMNPTGQRQTRVAPAPTARQTHTLVIEGSDNAVAYGLIAGGPTSDLDAPTTVDQFAGPVPGTGGALHYINGFVRGGIDRYEIEGPVYLFEVGDGPLVDITWDGQSILGNPQQIVEDAPDITDPNGNGNGTGNGNGQNGDGGTQEPVQEFDLTSFLAGAAAGTILS